MLGTGHSIDLNCDMGEGMDTDAQIFPFISSANIACGFHAGDEEIMRRTVVLALRHGVAIGAHPSYADRPGFGRTDRLESVPGAGDGEVRYKDLARLLTEQLDLLQRMCKHSGASLRHVKLHGALYNRAARDLEASRMICRAIWEFDRHLLIYGPSGSRMKKAAEESGLEFINEVFADRTYRPDGSLTPRTEPNALIEDEQVAIGQVLRMVKQGDVMTASGPVAIIAETICLHGDGAHAAEFAALIHEALASHGIGVEAPGV